MCSPALHSSSPRSRPRVTSSAAARVTSMPHEVFDSVHDGATEAEAVRAARDGNARHFGQRRRVLLERATGEYTILEVDGHDNAVECQVN